PRPWAAVVFAAVALAWAASRVRFVAVVRVRRPVDLLGAFAPVLRLVERVLAARVVVVLRAVELLRAVERRAAGLRALELVPEFVVPVLLVVFVVVFVAI